MADKASSRNGSTRGEPKAAVLALRPAPGPRAPGVRWEDNVATVAVRGELDREALWAIDYTVGRAAVEAGRIVLDLREVTHLDYSGVPELIARRRELAGRGGDLLIAVRNPYVSNILKAAGGPELALFRSVEEATSAVAAPAPRARAMRK
jgi:anti-anti-sigma factor